MNLRWKPSVPASALHAADRLIRGRPLVDPALQAALSGPAAELEGDIGSLGLPLQPLLANLTALAATFDGHRQLVEMALVKTVGRERGLPFVERLAGRIADIEIAFRGAIPDVAQQLELRSGPLREQWEARGPGLLASVARLTEPGLLVDEAEVILVYPAAGGGGRAHVPINSVRIEAVLTNPLPQLPEVVRLGWLLAQLNLDLPDYEVALPRDRAEFIGSLAIRPAILAAAGDVELARLDQPTLITALTAWECADPSLSPDDTTAANDTADQLTRWWETYQSTRFRWPIALAALDRILSAI